MNSENIESQSEKVNNLKKTGEPKLDLVLLREEVMHYFINTNKFESYDELKSAWENTLRSSGNNIIGLTKMRDKLKLRYLTVANRRSLGYPDATVQEILNKNLKEAGI